VLAASKGVVAEETSTGARKNRAGKRRRCLRDLASRSRVVTFRFRLVLPAPRLAYRRGTRRFLDRRRVFHRDRLRGSNGPEE
jgi:hypothetical protein